MSCGPGFIMYVMMKKRYTYIFLTIIFLAFTAFVVIKYNAKQSEKENTLFALLERKGPAAKLPEWADTKLNGDKLYRNLEVNPGDVKSKITLAGLFIQEARVTGNYNYYDAAAMKYIEEVLKENPKHY